MRPTCSPGAPRGLASAHACIQLEKGTLRGALSWIQLSISMRTIQYTEREDNAWERRKQTDGYDAKSTKERVVGGEKKETEPRKRVSLTNATRGRGRRVIITHLSPVGSAFLVEAVAGSVGPCQRPVEGLRPSVAFIMLVPARLFLLLSIIFVSNIYP